MSEGYFEYDFCLSFAGEQREYVKKVADELKSRGVRVFFDDYEKANLWGMDLYSHLCEIYQNSCMYCILFVSKEYANKVWTNHERKSAQARALEKKKEYILPARFDDTQISGLSKTVHYIDLRQTLPSDLANLAMEKLGTPLRRNYLPPVLDILYERLNIDKDDYETQGWADLHAQSFLQVLRRMTHGERNAILSLIRFGCIEELPHNIHIDADLLRRHTGESIASLKRLLAGVRSLGFECSFKESAEKNAYTHKNVLGDTYIFELNWVNLSSINERELPEELLVVYEMVTGVAENYCEEHEKKFLEELDFSQLSSATASKDYHNKK